MTKWPCVGETELGASFIPYSHQACLAQASWREEDIQSQGQDKLSLVQGQ